MHAIKSIVGPILLEIKEQKNDERKGERGSHVNNTGHTLLIIMSLFIGVYNGTSQITTF